MDTLHVLVVDDEPGMLSGIERVLHSMRISLPDVHAEVCFSIEKALSGEQAMAMIEARTPDILLLDHKLPGMSGLDILDKLNEQKKDIYTVMITAYASLETAVSAIKQGAYDFLAKPFTPAELKAVIRKVTQALIHTRQARNLAKERRQVRFQFISVLAHELKAPISAIEGYLDIICNRSAGDDPDVYEKMLNRCTVRLVGMRKMIMDLLDLTQIESGQRNRNLVDIDICQIAGEAIETFAGQAASRGISLNLHARQPITMLADRNEIEIILNNLLSNAIKYNRDNGSVNINLTCRDDIVSISVADTGIGIATEDADRLFNDFVRIKNTQTRNILGSGLGLSIVKKLTCLYAGDVSITSQPGLGSTFTATLSNKAQSLQ
jgi:two-component system, sensor histidine kinase and response regulator